MKIARYSYEKQFGEHPDELFKDLQRMILNGNYVLTQEVSGFLKNFANFTNALYACGTNSGTDALILALRVLNIGLGDEVITQANTFHATVAAIKFVGATPILVDADEEAYLINTHQLEDKITYRTRAIIPVHLYGKPSPMLAIINLADKYGLNVIEDCSQAHGSKIDGKNVGTFGNIGCFSFHPSKNLAAAGDGGCIITNDESLYLKAMKISTLGQNGQNNHVILGFNSKLDAIQARILDWKLPSLDSWNKARKQIAKTYIEQLSGLPISFQLQNENEVHTHHQFTVRTTRRDDLMTFLIHNGIEAVIRYPIPIHLQPAFA
ncbi:MAG: DegT/DnrJ/EryC1/StrS family aminotransferase, partial [Sphingobacteriales bacterium]